MAGLVPAIHVFFVTKVLKTRMPGTSPGMTNLKFVWPQTNYVAFFEANVVLMLSNNSTFTPLRRMMKLCCSTDKVLFQAQ